MNKYAVRTGTTKLQSEPQNRCQPSKNIGINLVKTLTLN